MSNGAPTASPLDAAGGAELLRAMFDAALDGMVLFDDGGRCLEANPAACAEYGVSRETLIGMSFREFAADVDEAEAQWRSFLANPSMDGELAIRRPDGALRVLSFRTRANLQPGVHLAVVRDGTAERAARAAVQRSEALFSAAFHQSPIAKAISSLPDGRILDINDAAARLAGFTREEMIGKCAYDLGVWVEPAQVYEQAQALGDGRLDNALARLRRRDGAELDLLISACTIEVDGVSCLLGVYVDITDTQRAQRELVESQRLLETSQAVAQIGSFSAPLTTDGPVRWSKQLYRILGIPEGTRVSFDLVHDLVHPDDRTRMVDAYRNLTEEFEVRVTRADGELRWVRTNVAPQYDDRGTLIGHVGTVQDITERRLADDARRSSDDRYRRIVETTSEGILITTTDHRFAMVNRQICEITGYAASELVGTPLLAVVAERMHASFVAALAARAAGASATYDLAIRRRDGSERIVQISASPLFDGAGEYEGSLGVVRDVTEQRRLEQSLREAQSQLWQLQKMEAIGSVAGGIAHDFNNILCVILWCATALDEMLDRNDPAAEEVVQIQQAAERAAHLTRQLLAFSRKQLLEPRVVKLDEIVAGMEPMLRRVVGPTIELDMMPEPALGNALVDPTQFEQVILNLAVNARDAMPRGGTLAIAYANVELERDHVPGAPAGRYVRVTVTDTGSGMDAATVERIFEPFFTTKPKGQGTGLGLSTVFGIVRQSGGQITVHSELGAGTTFALYLPSTDRAAREVPPSSVQVRQSHDELILLVEDEEPVRRALYNQLRHLGYRVIAAANAGEAVLVAEQESHEIDLLLTDLVMPIMNGKQLAERLVRTRPDMRVVFMSGYTADVISGDDLAVPFAFVQKPVRPLTLAAKLRDVLEGH